MFTLFTKFQNGMKIFSIPLSWFRKVTAYLNNICAGTGIKILQPNEPSDSSPVVISVDPAYIDARIAAHMSGDDNSIGSSAASIDARNTETDTSGTITLETNSWAAGSNGLILHVVTRSYTTPNASRYHFLMYRELRFSSKGQLLSVSAEKGYLQIRA